MLWIAYFYHTSTFDTNFLSPSLTIGEARDLSPRYTTTEDLAPVRDESVEHMSQSRKVHVPIEEPEVQARTAELETAEADQDAKMVTR